jgi:Uma2 family endonuclease
VREHHLVEVHIEAVFKLSSQTWLQPDVSFVRLAQIERGDPNEYYEGAPALAVEVASESNTAAQPDLKMELYFAHGTGEVWMVFPKTNRVRANFPDGHSETTRRQSSLGSSSRLVRAAIVYFR